jgi:hypothetical protein
MVCLSIFPVTRVIQDLPQGRHEIDPVQIAPFQSVDQDMDLFFNRGLPVDDQIILSPDPAIPADSERAVHRQRFIKDLYSQPDGQFFQMIQCRVIVHKNTGPVPGNFLNGRHLTPIPHRPSRTGGTPDQSKYGIPAKNPFSPPLEGMKGGNF